MPPTRKTRASATATASSASAATATSSKASGKQAQASKAPAVKATRAAASSRASAAATESTTPAPKRRLRSTAATSNSPLASLPEPTRKKTTKTAAKGKAAASTTTHTESEGSVGESIQTEAGQDSDGDPGANVFLKQLRQRENTVHTLEMEKAALQDKVDRGCSPNLAWKIRRDIEEHAKGVPRGIVYRSLVEEESEEDPDTIMQSPPVASAVATPAPVSTAQAPSTPEAAAATSAQPPSTPWSQSLLGWTRTLFGSASKNNNQQPAAPAEAAAPAVAPPSPLTIALTQSPTPVGEPRPRQMKRKKNKELSRTMDKVVYYTLKSSIAPEDWDQAKTWVVEASEKISMDRNAGDKRKRLQKGIKVGDLKAIPSTKPWKAQGSFGLDEDIEDLSDSEDAPAWAVAGEIIAEMDAYTTTVYRRPATKRRKLFTGGEEMSRARRQAQDDATQSAAPVESTGPSEDVSNTRTSADIHDVRSRPATEPSPMFDMAAVHRDGSNVFNELRGHAAGQQSAEERRQIHNAVPTEPRSYSQGFSVPEGDSDSEEENMQNNDWTQAPPPAPVPAHASLPNAFAESQRAQHVVEQPAQDPAEIQRAKLMKYTPAKPSRLREIHVPSPSLMSDAGASPAPATMIASADSDFMVQMPDAEPLDLPEDVQAYIDEYISSGEMQRNCDAAGWDDPIEEPCSDEEMSQE